MNRAPATSYSLVPPLPAPPRVAGFRLRLLVSMMLLVAGIVALALYLAQSGMAASFERELQRDFQAQIAVLHQAREVRRAALEERARVLVRRSRIQAALEDGALDLLYPNAEDELRDILSPGGESAGDAAGRGLRAEFYRFLDRAGAVIPPTVPPAVGVLRADEEAQLALPGRATQQIGYLRRSGADGGETLSEVIAVPIVSLESAEVIAALVLGFKPYDLGTDRSHSGVKSGIWMGGRLHSTALPPAAVPVLAAELSARAARQGGSTTPVRVTIEGRAHLLFWKQLNPASAFPAAYEISVYPLDELFARQRQLRWQVLGAGGLLFLVGLAGSHVASKRLSAPVERLAVDSEEDRARRARAEAALEMTSAELQRAARFSADASHQLKTPVTVLRAGLEELLARDNLTPAECEQLSGLIHQTYRLSSLIEDLLLLSRMDAGRLKLQLAPINLTELIAASLDDLSALPDELSLAVDTDFPAKLTILGEKRYTAMILQNLLENARKYNHPGGRIRVTAQTPGESVRLTIANTGRPISAAAQAHVFERFHRGEIGENVPGYGLGLNLARELARLHGGDLRLLRSDDSWTEFEVTFRVATVAAAT